MLYRIFASAKYFTGRCHSKEIWVFTETILVHKVVCMFLVDELGNWNYIFTLLNTFGIEDDYWSKWKFCIWPNRNCFLCFHNISKLSCRSRIKTLQFLEKHIHVDIGNLRPFSDLYYSIYIYNERFWRNRCHQHTITHRNRDNFKNKYCLNWNWMSKHIFLHPLGWLANLYTTSQAS